MSRYFARITSIGLTNRDTDDWGKLASASKSIIEAHCTSEKCCGRVISYVRGGKNLTRHGRQAYIIKHIPRTENTCPDCGQAILWKARKKDRYEGGDTNRDTIGSDINLRRRAEKK